MNATLNKNTSKKSGKNSPIPTAGLAELILLLLKKRIRLKISGHSMEPTIQNNNIILIKPLNQKTSLRPGDIIAFQHPFKKNLILVKKIQSIQENQITLIGINKNYSTDSRFFGPITNKHIIGTATSFIEQTTPH